MRVLPVALTLAGSVLASSGARAFDASLGGLGGCPYAPGATGNIVTEDLANGRERQGQFIAALQVIEAVVEAGHARELAAQRKSPHVAGDQTPCPLPRDLEHRQRQIDANR